MSPLSALSSERPTLPKIENPLAFTVGVASPLWFLFAGAAASGAAFWWLSQWSKPVNLEAEWAEKAANALAEPPSSLTDIEPEPVATPSEAATLESPEPTEAFVAAAEIVEAAPVAEAAEAAPAKPAVTKPKTVKPPPPVPDVPA